MNDANANIVVGVDAGGSKTIARVAQWRGESGPELQELGTGYAGPGNVRAVGMEITSASIESAIERAFADALIRNSSELPFKLCIAAAGAGRPDERTMIHEWAANRYPAANLYVTHDAEPILAAASDNHVGVALICGTGSLAWGRNRHGIENRCGGWGYLFGDEGSGYAIGVAALRAVAESADGRSPGTQLAESICDHFDLRDPTELIDKIYNEKCTRAEIAKLSELVFQLPDDKAACGIIIDAARSLAHMAKSLARRLGFHKSETTLAVGGGLLTHQAFLFDQVMMWLDGQFNRVEKVDEPVDGAIRLASRL